MDDQIVIWLIKAPLNLDRTKIGCKWNHKHAEQELLCLQDIKKEITGHPSRREIAPNKRKDKRMKLSKKIQQRLQKDLSAATGLKLGWWPWAGCRVWRLGRWIPRIHYIYLLIQFIWEFDFTRHCAYCKIYFRPFNSGRQKMSLFSTVRLLVFYIFLIHDTWLLYQSYLTKKCKPLSWRILRRIRDTLYT